MIKKSEIGALFACSVIASLTLNRTDLLQFLIFPFYEPNSRIFFSITFNCPAYQPENSSGKKFKTNIISTAIRCEWGFLIYIIKLSSTSLTSINVVQCRREAPKIFFRHFQGLNLNSKCQNFRHPKLKHFPFLKQDELKCQINIFVAFAWENFRLSQQLSKFCVCGVVGWRIS